MTTTEPGGAPAAEPDPRDSIDTLADPTPAGVLTAYVQILDWLMQDALNTLDVSKGDTALASGCWTRMSLLVELRRLMVEDLRTLMAPLPPEAPYVPS